jgi:hypothetical protein
MLQLGGDLDLAGKPLGTQGRSELGPQDLNGHLAMVFEVFGDVYGGHASAAQLSQHGVSAHQSCLETIKAIRHQRHPELAESRLKHGVEGFEREGPVVLQIVSEVDPGDAPAPKLEHEAITESLPELSGGVHHGSRLTRRRFESVPARINSLAQAGLSHRGDDSMPPAGRRGLPTRDAIGSALASGGDPPTLEGIRGFQTA